MMLGTVEIVFLLICLLVFMPTVVPFAILERVRMKRKIQRERCSGCGNMLDAAAVAKSDQEWAAHMDELRRERPNVKLRVVRSHHAICVTCGMKYQCRKGSILTVSEKPKTTP